MKSKYQKPEIIDLNRALDVTNRRGLHMCSTGQSARRGNCRIGPSTFF